MFDRAVKSFPAKRGCRHILSVNQLFFVVVVFVLLNIKFRATVSLNLIIIARPKASKQYALTSTRESLLVIFPPQKSLLAPRESFKKSLKIR